MAYKICTKEGNSIAFRLGSFVIRMYGVNTTHSRNFLNNPQAPFEFVSYANLTMIFRIFWAVNVWRLLKSESHGSRILCRMKRKLANGSLYRVYLAITFHFQLQMVPLKIHHSWLMDRWTVFNRSWMENLTSDENLVLGITNGHF